MLCHMPVKNCNVAPAYELIMNKLFIYARGKTEKEMRSLTNLSPHTLVLHAFTQVDALAVVVSIGMLRD